MEDSKAREAAQYLLDNPNLLWDASVCAGAEYGEKVSVSDVHRVLVAIVENN